MAPGDDAAGAPGVRAGSGLRATVPRRPGAAHSRRAGGEDATGPMSRERWEDRDEEAVRQFIESITHRIDSAAHVLLREPGRPSDPHLLRFALLKSGQALPFELSEAEWRDSRSALGRERLARRIGAVLGLQPPDQMTGPPRE